MKLSFDELPSWVAGLFARLLTLLLSFLLSFFALFLALVVYLLLVFLFYFRFSLFFDCLFACLLGFLLACFFSGLQAGFFSGLADQGLVVVGALLAFCLLARSLARTRREGRVCSWYRRLKRETSVYKQARKADSDTHVQWCVSG